MNGEASNQGKSLLVCGFVVLRGREKECVSVCEREKECVSERERERSE